MLLGWSPRKATTWVLVASLALAFAGFATIALLSQYDRHFNASIDPEGTVYQIYTQITRPGEEPQAMAASLPDLAGAITASVPGAKVGRITLSQEAQSVAVDHAASLERRSRRPTLRWPTFWTSPTIPPLSARCLRSLTEQW